MQIDLDALLRFLTLAFAAGSTLYAYASQRDKATNSQIRALEQKVLKLENDLAHVPDLRLIETRMQKFESDLAHVPDKDTLHRLELGMQEMAGKVEQMSQNWTSVTRSIQRLEEYLLQVQGAQTMAVPPATRRRK